MWDTVQFQMKAVILMIYPNNKSSCEVSKTVGIPARTLRKWRLHYDKFGEVPAQSRKDRRKFNRGSKRRLAPVVFETLKVLALEHCSYYLDEFQKELQTRTGALVHCSTIYRYLTKHMNWSLSKAFSVALERDEIARAEHMNTLNEVTQDPMQFVFIDETHKDRLAAGRARAWHPRGVKNDVSRCFSDHKDYRYTMLAAADMNGFIVEACEIVRRKHGSSDHDSESGTVDSERFLEWVRYTLVPCLGNYLLGEARSIVVMDNASIHFAPEIAELIDGAGALLIYQSAYSPDLNPIEFCFHQYKACLKRNSRLCNSNFVQAHQLALESVSRSNMCSYYRKVGCIQNVPDVVDKVDEDLYVTRVILALSVANSVDSMFLTFIDD